jgi:hypothetical protein
MQTLILVFSFLQTPLPYIPLPDGNGAWIVRVVTSGGILGNGGGDLSISSESKISCSALIRCPSDIKVSDFQPLIDKIQAGILLPSVPVVSLCRDCITRVMTITRRDQSGLVQTFTASWDDTTKVNLPQEVIRLYDALLDLVK